MSEAMTYRGDDRLEGLLVYHGVNRDIAWVKSLVAGVASAPAGIGPDAWVTDLVHPHAEGELREQLVALRDQLAGRAASRIPRRERLVRLRDELRQEGLDGFLVPRADEHQGEYVPPSAERLAWLTGFTGSAGMAVVLRETAAIFVDGRYTLQAAAEVDTEEFTPRHLITEPPETWISEHLSAGARLGYDPWLHTRDQVERLRKACEQAGGTLVACARSPLDGAWTDRPPAPLAAVHPHPEAFSGRSSEQKRRDIAEALGKGKLGACVLSAPDAVAWLLNIRGGDVAHTPLALSFAVLHADATVDLCIDDRKLPEGTRAFLGRGVRIHPPDGLGPLLDALGAAAARVRVDRATGPAWVADRLEAAGATVDLGEDPCSRPKARKNPAELEGIRAAHRRDGAALTRFLCWVTRAAQAGRVTELGAVDALYALRRENEHFRDLSFPTISGACGNGAIVHYRVTEATDRALDPGLYLVDSGAQYLDGTTDVTRTVAIGPPTDEQRDRFTRVLKGHITLATAVFPEGTSGVQLDALARMALWQVGLDYDHGTGHGVGHYLGVHEGPQRIATRGSDVPLEPGMVVSNEPGYYKAGGYGIRIENLVVVCEAPERSTERPMRCFETLTLAPIDRTLVDPELLTEGERGWLNAYHERVRTTLTPLVDPETAEWLVWATAPI